MELYLLKSHTYKCFFVLKLGMLNCGSTFFSFTRVCPGFYFLNTLQKHAIGALVKLSLTSLDAYPAALFGYFKPMYFKFFESGYVPAMSLSLTSLMSFLNTDWLSIYYPYTKMDQN